MQAFSGHQVLRVRSKGNWYRPIIIRIISQSTRAQTLTRMRLGHSHLRYVKFKHDFLDTINPFCSCGSDIETALHLVLYWPNFLESRNTLLRNISEINDELITRNDLALIETLLFGYNSFSQYDNLRIVDAAIAFTRQQTLGKAILYFQSSFLFF